jgi:Mn-dependent DtxR family transcriptional regulator
MEHALTDDAVLRIEEMLGYPEVDPHGQPIPRRPESTAKPGRSAAA